MSFIITIKNNNDEKCGTIVLLLSFAAIGEFTDPTTADVLVTIPAEDFIRIYQGNTSVSAITSLVLRGKIAVYLFLLFISIR